MFFMRFTIYYIYTTIKNIYITIIYFKFNNRFFEKTGFPGVIGAIDGTHIAIFPPESEREHLFINRKLYHSLNVMIVIIKQIL